MARTLVLTLRPSRTIGLSLNSSDQGCIGFAPQKASPEAVQHLVEASLPPQRAYYFHVELISHGRTVCKAQRPRCDECPIRRLCRFGMEAPAAD